MRVAYFWFDPWPAAEAALPADAERIYTGPDTGDYWKAFASQWTGEGDLVSIEQDVAIHDQVIPQFEACPEPWCSFGWMVGPGQHSFWWLGCTRYSAALQRAIPVSELCRPNPPDVCERCTSVPCHRHLDVVFGAIIEHLGYEWPHVHQPDIRHLRAELI